MTEFEIKVLADRIVDMVKAGDVVSGMSALNVAVAMAILDMCHGDAAKARDGVDLFYVNLLDGISELAEARRKGH